MNSIVFKNKETFPLGVLENSSLQRTTFPMTWMTHRGLPCLHGQDKWGPQAGPESRGKDVGFCHSGRRGAGNQSTAQSASCLEGSLWLWRRESTTVGEGPEEAWFLVCAFLVSRLQLRQEPFKNF